MEDWAEIRRLHKAEGMPRRDKDGLLQLASLLMYRKPQKVGERPMATNRVDVTVCGNGAVGAVSALVLSWRHPGLNIALIGPYRRQWSASVAAGAMIAVLAEVESSLSDINGFHEEALHLGIESSRRWRSMLTRLGAEDVITAQDTVVYLQRGAGGFELANFEAVTGAAEGQARLREVASAEMQAIFQSGQHYPDAAIEISGEFAVDPDAVFARVDAALMAGGVLLIDDVVERFDPDSLSVVTAQGRTFQSDRVVMCMGAQTESVLPPGVVQPILQGVGTAFVANASAASLMPGLGDRVVRSVNRGGAQCGIHLLPRLDGTTYVGAGNYVASPGPPETRFETVRYLLDVAERDLVGRKAGYALKGELLLGNRPRSLDGLPLIGPLESYPGVFVATATNRLGLTWAPTIGEWVASWISEGDELAPPRSWAPEREPVPFGPREQCYSYFIESRVGNALEHGLVTSSGEEAALREELLVAAGTLERELRSRNPGLAEELPSPDVWAWLANEGSS